MQHNQRAIPFRKNGKPSKINSLSTVTFNFTRNPRKSKPRLFKQSKTLVSASYDPLTGFLYRSYITRSKSNTSHYELHEKLVTRSEVCDEHAA